MGAHARRQAQHELPTQEATLEVAIGKACGDLRSGHDIVIELVAATDPAGARDRGEVPVEGDDFR